MELRVSMSPSLRQTLTGRLVACSLMFDGILVFTDGQSAYLQPSMQRRYEGIWEDCSDLSWETRRPWARRVEDGGHEYLNTDDIG